MINECCDHVRLAGTHELELTGDTDLELYADRQRIDQVVVNFVNNAVKYAPDSNRIVINISKQDNMAKISVQDFGRGIPPENIPHLFERYYRVDTSGIQYSGLGLGLYISAEIIELHGGKMGVESEVDKGSTFWFTIPLN
ncbi:sensor histidine kinase [Mucilaginibacter sp. UC70_90]